MRLRLIPIEAKYNEEIDLQKMKKLLNSINSKEWRVVFTMHPDYKGWRIEIKDKKC